MVLSARAFNSMFYFASLPTFFIPTDAIPITYYLFIYARVLFVHKIYLYKTLKLVNKTIIITSRRLGNDNITERITATPIEFFAPRFTSRHNHMRSLPVVVINFIYSLNNC